MVKLYGKPIKVNKASQDKRTQEVGANLFVGNLHDEVDEKMLRDIFNSFGVVLATKVYYIYIYIYYLQFCGYIELILFVLNLYFRL